MKTKSARAESKQAEFNMAHISEFIKKFRNSNDLNLDQLAEKADVSRSMICQIETGKTTPTINVLWKLAHAMDTPIGQLVDPGGRCKRYCLHRGKVGEKLSSADGSFQRTNMVHQSANDNIQITDFAFKKKGKHVAFPHPKGTVEFVIVEDGEMIVEVGEEPVELKKGDTLEFRAAIRHAYIQSTGKLCKGKIVKYYM